MGSAHTESETGTGAPPVTGRGEQWGLGCHPSEKASWRREGLGLGFTNTGQCGYYSPWGCCESPSKSSVVSDPSQSGSALPPSSLCLFSSLSLGAQESDEEPLLYEASSLPLGPAGAHVGGFLLRGWSGNPCPECIVMKRMCFQRMVGSHHCSYAKDGGHLRDLVLFPPAAGSVCRKGAVPWGLSWGLLFRPFEL